MRITLLMNADVASNFALNRLVQSWSKHELTVFVSERLGKGGTVPQVLHDLRFVEQDLFNRLLFPLLERAGIRSQLLSFAELGALMGRPVRPLNGINTPAGLNLLRASEPELMVSMRYGGFLKQPAIELPRFGVLNLHAGLLPQYQGLMATFRAMLEQRTEYGCTLHYIVDEQVDTGPIVEQRRLPIDPQRSYLWHVLNLYPDACEMVCAAVERIEGDGSVPSTPHTGDGRYFTLPGQAELQRFESLGLKLFDSDDILSLAHRYVA